MTSIGRTALALGLFLISAVIPVRASIGPGPAWPPSAVPPHDSLTGRLLVAAPDMPDPRFFHAVILVVHHGPRGTLGIVINRPVGKRPLADILAALGLKSKGVAGSIEVYAGGPLQPKIGFVVHSVEYRRPGTLEIDGQVAVTARRSVLRDIAEKRGPRKYLVAFGYAGWAPGQLENEIRHGAWFIVPDDPKLLFDDARARLWRDALARREGAL